MINVMIFLPPGRAQAGVRDGRWRAGEKAPSGERKAGLLVHRLDLHVHRQQPNPCRHPARDHWIHPDALPVLPTLNQVARLYPTQPDAQRLLREAAPAPRREGLPLDHRPSLRGHVRQWFPAAQTISVQGRHGQVAQVAQGFRGEGRAKSATEGAPATGAAGGCPVVAQPTVRPRCPYGAQLDAHQARDRYLLLLHQRRRAQRAGRRLGRPEQPVQRLPAAGQGRSGPEVTS